MGIATDSGRGCGERKGREMKDLTRGQMSKIAGCATRTVSKWMDSGNLKAYRLPMSNDRRVRPDDFAAFLREHGMEDRIPLIEVHAKKEKVAPAPVLYVGFGAHVHQALSRGVVKAAFADSLFTAGMAAATHKPRVVVVSSGLGVMDAVVLAEECMAIRAKTVIVNGFGGETDDNFDVIAPSISHVPDAVRGLLS